MATTSLNFTKRLRDSLAQSEARAIIGALLTLGFIAVNILAAMGLMTSEIYIVIMQWYVPLQAVVVGFYFGTPKTIPTTMPAGEDEIPRLMTAVAQLAEYQKQLTAQLQVLNAQVQKLASVEA